MASALGECEKCHGDLCVRGKPEGPEVSCSRCGVPHADHPVAKEMAEKLKQQRQAPAPAVVLPASDFAGSDRDRIGTLEKLVVALQTEMALLKQQVKRKP